ncbi:MAG: TRAP transporter small permease [Pseudolabrys sp.]|jgi:TRAP-type C4-dicarboxylate transport system permease small subunit
MSNGNSHLDKLVARATSALFVAGLLALGALTALVVAQVVCRDFFDLGLPWADELARFCGIALVFLSIPRLLLNGGHVAVDILPNALGPGKRAVLGRINNLLILLFCAVVLYGMYEFLLRAGKFATPAMGIPNWLYYLPAVLGLVLFAVVALQRVVPRRTRRDAPKEPTT